MSAPGGKALASTRAGDAYLLFLALCLAGYAVLGKSFAYIGLSPLFIGEILLLLGLFAFLLGRSPAGVLASVPAMVLAALMGWVLLRTLPFLGPYGIDAPRDSVVVMYGLFAFVVIGLLLEAPRRAGLVMDWFSRFFGAYAFLAPLVPLGYLFASSVPTLPGTGLPLVSVRPGELAVHLCGAVLFVLLGFRRVGPIWVALIVGTMVFAASQSRGAMLAMAVPVLMAIALGARVGRLVAVAGLLFAAVAGAYILDLKVPLSERDMDVAQLVDNMISIVKPVGDAALDGTKQWRLRWWEEIFSYTIRGDYFWTGKGFGINLADADGFTGTAVPGAPPLRSPHNVHMTMLARAGIPGLVLWGLLLAAWGVEMLKARRMALHCGDRAWANAFVFFLCYLTAMVVNASFDVALEGPMIGIWFWTLFGLGLGFSMVYRAGAGSRS